ncbi:hypothetical protein MMC07_000250 [Pseudocyphellaria aurata]|nr:hypothetical protein [Pseudocyphellaria aurata]
MKYLTCAVRGIPANTKKESVANNFNVRISRESPCIAHVVADETQGNSCAATVTFRRETKGQKRSCETLRKEFNGSTWQGTSSTISVVDDFMGLTPLSGTADADVHVYFVHGLGGHAFRSWCSDADDDITKMTAWPRDFLPKGLLREGIKARIFSLGYNANSVRGAAPNATIQSTAEDLLAHLLADRIALIMALFQDENYPNKQPYRDLFMHENECLVKGVCLMGTPFHGSGHANLLAPFVRAVKGINIISAANDKLLVSLKENNHSLEISNIIYRFRSIAEKTKMRLLIGCEEIPVAGSKLTVTYESAVSIFGDIAVPFRIHADHRRMVKFDDSGRADYKTLEGLIIKMIQDRLTQKPTARPTEEAHYHTGDSSSSPLAQSPTSPPDSKHGEASHQSMAININLYHPFDRSQSSIGDQQDSDEQQYNIKDGRSNQPHRPFNARDMPSKQKTAPVKGAQNRSSRSDSKVPSVNTDYGPSENPPAPLRRKTDSQTPRINTDDDVFNRLRFFDTVFIIDDTGSMQLPLIKDEADGPNRWDVTKDALKHIAEIAATHDEDGIDVLFLKAEEFNENNIKSGQRVEEILEDIDVTDENHGGGTKFKSQLDEVIRGHLHKYEDYVEELAAYDKKFKGRAGMRAPKEPKFLNVIVITDGEADDDEEVEEYIVKVAKKLDKMDAPKNYIGIQFIQIGDDEKATSFLARLDDELRTQANPIRDIVDTTPYYGSESNISFSQVLEDKLKKLLLGGVTKRYDNMQNNKSGR